VAALAFDCAGDRRGGDRIAGADFGSIFPDNAVGPNGYTPFINIRTTSHEEHWQIYIPQINTLLAVGCIALVLIFRNSDALASAYGIAVTLTMIATTVLLYFAVRRVWKWSALRANCAVCAVPRYRTRVPRGE
jgi:K+ transporter